MISQLPKQKLEQILETAYKGDTAGFLHDIDDYVAELQQRTASRKPHLQT
jgi:hypothetical protein